MNKVWIALAIVTAAMAISYVGLPRGLRNKNPGNIRFNASNNWDGQIGKDDRGFARFDSMHHGLRAAAKLLLNYQRLHNLTTIQQIIGRWAPTNENNTSSYIDSVATAMTVSPAQYLPLTEQITLAELLTAIVKHENGIQPFSQETINRAVLDALA